MKGEISKTTVLTWNTSFIDQESRRSVGLSWGQKLEPLDNPNR